MGCREAVRGVCVCEGGGYGPGAPGRGREGNTCVLCCCWRERQRQTPQQQRIRTQGPMGAALRAIRAALPRAPGPVKLCRPCPCRAPYLGGGEMRCAALRRSILADRAVRSAQLLEVAQGAGRRHADTCMRERWGESGVGGGRGWGREGWRGEWLGCTCKAVITNKSRRRMAVWRKGGPAGTNRSHPWKTHRDVPSTATPAALPPSTTQPPPGWHIASAVLPAAAVASSARSCSSCVRQVSGNRGRERGGERAE